MAVHTASTTIYINGRNMGDHKVTISAEIGDDLPGRLNVTSGVKQRTGKIYWNLPREVTNRQLSPWNPRDVETGFTLPKKGDRVAIDMTLDGVTTRVFTGKVDNTTGRFTTSPVTEIIDDIDKLNRISRVNAYRHHMPPKRNGGNQYLHSNVTPETTLTWLARNCGFHNTPARWGGTYILDATLQGTAQTQAPVYGDLTSAYRNSSRSADIPVFKEDPIGLTLNEGLFTYTPYNKNYSPKRLVVSFMRGENHAGDSSIILYVGGTQLRVTLWSSGRITAHVAGTMHTGFYTKPNQTIQVAFTPGSVTFKTITDEQTVSTAGWSGTIGDTMTISAASGSSIAGVQIFDTGDSSIFPHTEFRPTLNIKCGYPYPLHTARSIRDERAIDVIEEIAKALMLSVWIDGKGVLNMVYSRVAWYSRDYAPPMHYVTSETDILDVAWSDSTLYTANDVYVEYLTADTTWTNKSAGSFVDLWSAPDEQYEANESRVHWFGPETSEEWIEVNTDWRYPGGSDDDRLQFARRNGTFIGFASPDNPADQTSDSEHWTGGSAKLETVTPWVFKMTLTPNNPASTHVPKSPSVPKTMWGKAVPIVRGGALVKYVKASPIKLGGGIETSADLYHETQSWATDTRSTELCTHLREHTLGEQSVLTDLPMFFNPAIDVGHRIRITLTDSDTGVNAGTVILIGYVLKVDHDMTNDSTTATVRVYRIANNWTWGAVAQKFNTYTEIADTYTTYGDLEANNAH